MADAQQARREPPGGSAWMPWRRVEDWPDATLDGCRWWTALAIGADVVGWAAVWREAAGWVGWVNPPGPTERATHPSEREAMQWCQERLREAAREWTGGSMAQPRRSAW